MADFPEADGAVGGDGYISRNGFCGTEAGHLLSVTEIDGVEDGVGGGVGHIKLQVGLLGSRGGMYGDTNTADGFVD